MNRGLLITIFLLLIAVFGAGTYYAFTSAGDGAVSYTVIRGDTLGEIAKDYHVTVGQIRRWNGLQDDRIEVGDVLRIFPGTAKSSPRTPTADREAQRPRGKHPSQLQKPKPKPCLKPPSGDVGEQGMAASQGLAQDDINAALDKVFPRTNRCADRLGVPEGELVFEIRVSCGGVIDRIKVLDDPGWDPAVTRCVSGILEYAEFPAHALPDGEVFQQPVRFR